MDTNNRIIGPSQSILDIDLSNLEKYRKPESDDSLKDESFIITENRKNNSRSHSRINLQKMSGTYGDQSLRNSKSNSQSWLLKMSIQKKENKALPSKMYSLISKLYIVIHFLMKLKEASFLRKPKFLSKFHFEIISDNCFSYKSYKKGQSNGNSRNSQRKSLSNLLEGQPILTETKSYKSIILNYIKQTLLSLFFKLMNIFPVVDPTKRSTILIEIPYLLLIIIQFTILPIELAFNIDIFEDLKIQNFSVYIIILKILPLILFIFYAFVDIHKAYYKRGILVTDRMKIVERYWKNDAIIDLSSIFYLVLSIIWIIFGMENQNSIFIIRIISMLFFLKIKKFIHIMEEVEEYLYLDESTYNIFSLFGLIYKTLFILHILSCIWFAIGNSDENKKSWILSRGLINEQWGIKYVYSFYFIVITMNTVGYGDIYPTNVQETVFTIVLVYFACGVFAYTLTCIGNILNDISRRQNVFKRQINVINGYMKKKKISFNLRKNVRKYLEYIWSEEISQNQKEEDMIINSLSESLKENLLLEANGYPLKSVKFMCNNFSEEVLRKTVFIMKEIRFIPGELIYMKDDYQDNALFLIRKGEVGKFIESNNVGKPYNVITKLGKGDVFGKEEFFSDESRKIGAVSIDYTTVLKIKLSDFLGILNDYPEDLERFHLLKNNIRLNDDMKDLQKKCPSCQKLDHTLIKCPWIHRRFLKSIILSKYDFSDDQNRVNFFRNKNLNYTIKNLNEIVHYVLLAQENIIDNQTFSDLENIEDLTQQNNDIEVESEDEKHIQDNSELPNEMQSINLDSNFRFERGSIRFNTMRDRSLNEIPISRRRSEIFLQRQDSLNSNKPLEPHITRTFSKTDNASEKNKNPKQNSSDDFPKQISDIFDTVENFHIFHPTDNIENILKNYRIHNYKGMRKKSRQSKFLDKSIDIPSKELMTFQSKKSKRNIILEKDNFFHTENLNGFGKRKSILRTISDKIPSNLGIRNSLINLKKFFKNFSRVFKTSKP